MNSTLEPENENEGETGEEPQLSILILDRDEKSALKLLRALEPEIEFDQVDFSSSLPGGVEYFEEAEFQICFVADAFPERMLREFFKDVRKVDSATLCKFVFVYDPGRTFIGQTHDKTLVSIDPELYQRLGFHGFVSRDGTPDDKELLSELLNLYNRAKDVRERSDHVRELVDLVLVEVDRVAAALKRGRKKKFNTIILDFVHKETAFDQKVLLSYFDSLIKRSQEFEPFEEVQRNAALAGSGLPGLNDDGVYAGTSDRVVDKLSQLEKRARSGAIDLSDMPEPLDEDD